MFIVIKERISELVDKYQWLVLYGLFGVGTLAVNIYTYAFCARQLSMGTAMSNFFAWLLALLFAYVTNRKWVFESDKTGYKEIWREFKSFTSCRIMTGMLDIFLMVFLVDGLHLYDMKVKVFTNIVVIIINLLACKKIIFKTEEDELVEVELADKYLN